MPLFLLNKVSLPLSRDSGSEGKNIKQFRVWFQQHNIAFFNTLPLEHRVIQYECVNTTPLETVCILLHMQFQLYPNTPEAIM